MEGAVHISGVSRNGHRSATLGSCPRMPPFGAAFSPFPGGSPSCELILPMVRDAPQSGRISGAAWTLGVSNTRRSSRDPRSGQVFRPRIWRGGHFRLAKWAVTYIGEASMWRASRTMPVNLGWPCWIGVVAEDLEAQRRFYRDVLRMTEVAASSDWVQFDLGGGNLLEVLQRSEDPESDRVRCQVGYMVKDVQSARSELIARGVQAISEVRSDPQAGGPWCCFLDAEGNVFEIKERA